MKYTFDIFSYVSSRSWSIVSFVYFDMSIGSNVLMIALPLVINFLPLGHMSPVPAITTGRIGILFSNAIWNAPLLNGRKLSLNLGLSHSVEMDIPDGIEVKMEGNDYYTHLH